MDNKKIVLRFKGGLGNQLFIYSFYLYLKSKVKTKIIIDKTSAYSKLLYGNQFNEKFLINKIDKNLNYLERSIFFGLKGKFFRLIIKNSKLLQKIFNINYIKSENYKQIIKEINNSNYRNFYIDGYFQSNFLANFGKNIIRKKLNKFKKKTNKNKIILCYTFYEWENKNRNIKKKIKAFIKKNNEQKIFVVSKKPEEFINWLGNKKLKISEHNYIKDPFIKLCNLTNFKNYIINESTFHFWIVQLSKYNSLKVIGKKSKLYKLL